MVNTVLTATYCSYFQQDQIINNLITALKTGLLFSFGEFKEKNSCSIQLFMYTQFWSNEDCPNNVEKCNCAHC